MKNYSLNEELETVLHNAGAALVGFADMTEVDMPWDYPRGAAVAVPIPQEIALSLQTAPTREYYDLYHTLNSRLNRIVCAGETFLTEAGYRAYAQTTDRVQYDRSVMRSALPHKTVATRAGLGWIGRSCLLVTETFGSAVRISSLLTDAPLDCAEPIVESRCGKCRACVDNCPAQALSGALWSVGMDRDVLLDWRACREKQKELMLANTGIDTDLCGRCFAVCPYTRRYLRR